MGFLIGRGQTDVARALSFGIGGLIWLIGRLESLGMEDRDIYDVFQEQLRGR